MHLLRQTRGLVRQLSALARSQGSQQSGSQIRSAWVDSRGYEHFEGRGPWGAFTSGTARYLAGGSLVAAGAYYFSAREEVPYTHRKHAILFVTRNMELSMGRQTFDQVRAEAAAAGQLLPEPHPYVQIVRRVGERISQVAGDGSGGGYQAHMQGLRWEFAVINSPQVNAFVAPGGKVVVYTGLLRLMAHEDELGAVLAHETAHVLARHHAERISQMNLTGLLNMLLRVFLGIPLPGTLVLLGMFLPYSRSAEFEADAIGIRLLARACYDPDANVRMLAKLHAQEKRSESVAGMAVPQLFRTHPLTDERVSRVRALLPEAYEIYNQHCARVQDAWGRLGGGALGGW